MGAEAPTPMPLPHQVSFMMRSFPGMSCTVCNGITAERGRALNPKQRDSLGDGVLCSHHSPPHSTAVQLQAPCRSRELSGHQKSLIAGPSPPKRPHTLDLGTALVEASKNFTSFPHLWIIRSLTHKYFGPFL